MDYRILVVDDSKAALYMLQKILQLSGIAEKNILTAENGLRAVEILKKESFDLVMTDINMPEMDGFELISFLKNHKEQAGVPVVVITTEGRDKYVKKALELGAAGYIKKPFSPEEVKKIFQEILEVENGQNFSPDPEGSDF